MIGVARGGRISSINIAKITARSYDDGSLDAPCYPHDHTGISPLSSSKQWGSILFWDQPHLCVRNRRSMPIPIIINTMTNWFSIGSLLCCCWCCRRCCNIIYASCLYSESLGVIHLLIYSYSKLEICSKDDCHFLCIDVHICYQYMFNYTFKIVFFIFVPSSLCSKNVSICPIQKEIIYCKSVIPPNSLVNLVLPFKRKYLNLCCCRR